MNLVQITPGAGGMYCGNCFRDNALVAELRRQGHSTLMLPLYLPMTLDEADQAAGSPIFFGGINVYLEQISPLYRHAPNWLRDLLSSPRLLKLAAGKAAKTRASDLGELTHSMLRGEDGNQVRELDEMIDWLKLQPKPDFVFLSNALLLGLARRLRQDLQTRIVCTLQGEDGFLDSLPEPHRTACWDLLASRARGVDLFLAPSRYFGDLMRHRLRLQENQLQVVHNGISLAGYEAPSPSPAPGTMVLGYFARMCPEKGLDRLIDAFIIAKREVPNLRLKVGGSCGPADEAFVQECRDQLSKAGVLNDVEFHPNLDRAGKIRFLKSLSLFSVPASYSESFGLYVIEAMAAGVPVIQPRRCSFPELIQATGGGLLCESTTESLAAHVVKLTQSPEQLRLLGQRGHQAISANFTVEAMAKNVLGALQKLK